MQSCLKGQRLQSFNAGFQPRPSRVETSLDSLKLLFISWIIDGAISLLQLCSEKCCSSTVAHEVIHASSLLMNAFRGSPFLPQSWYYHLLPAACRYLIQTGVFWAWHNFQCFVDIINKTLKVWNFFETDIRLYIYKKQQSLLVWAVKVFVPYSLEYRPLQIFAICFYLGFTQRPNFFLKLGDYICEYNALLSLGVLGRWGKCCTSCISLSWSKVSDRHNQTHPSKHSLVLVVYESTVTFGSFSAGYDGRTYFVFARLRSPLLHCVLAVTLASFSPHDSSGFSLFCYLLPCFPLSTPSFSISLTFQCNSCCSVKKKKPQLIGDETESKHSAFYKNTCSYRQCKKM